MRLADLLDPSRIKVPIEARERTAAVRELARLVAPAGDGEVDEIVRAVEEREAQLPTGIGHGVAIPHGKSASLGHLVVAAGVAREPIPFGPSDETPVRILFLLVGPESESAAHVQAIGRIARLTGRADVRRRLLNVTTSKEFLRIVRSAEEE